VRASHVVALVYAALLLEDASTAVFLPLAPEFAADFGLSKVQTGALFAAVSFGMVAFSFPAGLFADRVGSRAVTAAGCALLALSAAGQAAADGFGTLLAARAVNGLSHAVLWTAAIAWLSDHVPRHRRNLVLGGSITISSMGWIGAPVVAGVLADQVGRWVPFVLLATAAGVVCAGILATPPTAADGEPPEPRSLRSAFGAAAGSTLLVGAVAVMAVDGFTNSAVNLLAPLQLRANGLSPSAIGVVVSASAVLFTAGSALTARLGGRAVRLDAAGASVLAVGAVVLLLAVGTATPIVVAGFLASTAAGALLVTVVYPLGAAGAEAAGVGRGAVLGLLNMAVGASAAVAPVAGGALAGAAGDRVAYLLVAGLTLATGAWLVSAGRRAGRRAAAC
jgi:MFS family permease